MNIKHRNAVERDSVCDPAQLTLETLRRRRVCENPLNLGVIQHRIGEHDVAPGAFALYARGDVHSRAKVIEQLVGVHGDAWAAMQAKLDA